MPKGHSVLEAEVRVLLKRVQALEELALQVTATDKVDNATYEYRIAALEHRIAQMNDAFSRGNLPSPLGHGSQWTQ